MDNVYSSGELLYPCAHIAAGMLMVREAGGRVCTTSGVETPKTVLTDGTILASNSLQYEVFKNKLSIPILRATGIISNPKNPARTTPAGPPLDVNDLQMLGRNKAEFYVFFGNENAFNDVLNKVYNYIVV